jgi:hypothetical protein
MFYTESDNGWFESLGILQKKTKVTKRLKNYLHAFVPFVIFC